MNFSVDFGLLGNLSFKLTNNATGTANNDRAKGYLQFKLAKTPPRIGYIVEPTPIAPALKAIAWVIFFPRYKASREAPPSPYKIRHSTRERKLGAKADKIPPRAKTNKEGIIIFLKPKRSAKIANTGVPSATGIK